MGPELLVFWKMNVPATTGEIVTLEMKSASVSFNTTLIIFGKTICGFDAMMEREVFAYEGI
jgi:hypothetical protein